MGNHLHTRLKRVIADTLDTCESGGMSGPDIVAVFTSVLLTLATESAVILQMPTDEYAALCRAAHAREMAKRFNRKKKQAKQSQS